MREGNKVVRRIETLKRRIESKKRRKSMQRRSKREMGEKLGDKGKEVV